MAFKLNVLTSHAIFADDLRTNCFSENFTFAKIIVLQVFFFSVPKCEISRVNKAFGMSVESESLQLEKLSQATKQT